MGDKKYNYFGSRKQLSFLEVNWEDLALGLNTISLRGDDDSLLLTLKIYAEELIPFKTHLCEEKLRHAQEELREKTELLRDLKETVKDLTEKVEERLDVLYDGIVSPFEFLDSADVFSTYNGSSSSEGEIDAESEDSDDELFVTASEDSDNDEEFVTACEPKNNEVEGGDSSDIKTLNINQPPVTTYTTTIKITLVKREVVLDQDEEENFVIDLLSGIIFACFCFYLFTALPTSM